MIFLVIFSTVLLIVYSYVGYRLLWPLDIASYYKTLLFVLLVIFYCFPIITFAFYFNKVENNFTRIIAWLGYTGLGTVTLFFFMQIGIDLLLLLKTVVVGKNHFDPHRRAFIGLSLKGIVGSLGAIGTVWGLYNAIKTPLIKKIQIPINGLPKELKNIRMAQITDLHASTMITNKYVEDLGEARNTKYDIEYLHYEVLYNLYVLTDDKNYLKMSYNKIDEEAEVLSKSSKPELKNEFLNRYFQKMIIDEYNKVFK